MSERGVAGSSEIMSGAVRAIIDAVFPTVDCGRFPAKCVAGEPVTVEAHCLVDGHDRLRVVLQWQLVEGAAGSDARAGATPATRQAPDRVREIEMTAQPNDVWLGEIVPPTPGRYRFSVLAWLDHFSSWRHDFERRNDPQDVQIALLAGAQLVEQAARAAFPGGDAVAQRVGSDDAAARGDAAILSAWANALRAAAASSRASFDLTEARAMALDAAREEIMRRYADRTLAVGMSRELIADRKRASFSSWYELFPRSAAAQAGRHGTFKDVEARLPYVAELGFDVLYFPPIHPIGTVNRKGKNNALAAGQDDVGSPWAIGSAEGGHKDIHRELGTLDDFRSLVAKAEKLGLEIALDIAFQCAPDHPYVASHPQWFKRRPDGSIQYAENPPKKYQDIYPFDFESTDWHNLWKELKSIFDFWIGQGVKIFRVDNPHTKSLVFWEWAINAIKEAHPDVIFLAEAFTRPKVMHRLAKLGYTQSYTYFTWRVSKYELVQYFTELSQGPGREYYRPNVWPNTPDILHASLQSGLRSMFSMRLLLAATLSANYGIYGPAFELMEHRPREDGSEEYLDSEKYQLRHWDLEKPESLRYLIARINRIRKDDPALQSDRSLRFCPIDNEQLIAYVKSSGPDDIILTIVNLDPYNAQSGWVELELASIGFDVETVYQAHDLLSEQRFTWRGRRNYVLLNPSNAPGHVFKLRKLVRNEQNFDYFE